MSGWFTLGFISFLLLLLIFHFWNEGQRKHEIEGKYGDTDEGRAISNKQVFIGMSEWQLRDSWGHPKSIASRRLKTKIKETWIYDAANHIYLEDGYVVGWKQRR